jgi:hypothetical protein
MKNINKIFGVGLGTLETSAPRNAKFAVIMIFGSDIHIMTQGQREHIA